MVFKRMALEDWFDTYQYEVDYDIGESGMKFLKVADLDIDLNDVELRYGYHLGAPELREEISSLYGLTKENVAVTTGASESNFAVIAHLAVPDKHMIVEHPTYPSLYEVPRSLSLDLSLMHLKWENRFKPDIDELRALIKPSTRLITLTHPNNPTGSQIDEKTLLEIIDIAESNDIYVMLDETYRDLTFKEPPPLAATLSKNAISLTSMSKVYGIPGIRIGWAVADKPIIEGIRAVREQVTICNSSLGEAIALEVLRRRKGILPKIKSRVLSNYAILKEWMEKQPWLEWIEPEGGVVCAPRLHKRESTMKVCRLLVEKYRTFVVPGYGLEMDDYVRLGYGGSEEELVKGLERLRQALNELYG